MKLSSIPEIFDAFTKLKVLIIGDVMVDSYIIGSVSRISPEAPVPIMNVRSKENRLGGAANVALNVQALGAEPILCSIIGDDPAADTFLSVLKKEGMTRKGIIRSQRRTTTVKNRVISNGHHLIRIDEEVDQSLDQLDQKSLTSHIGKLMDECDVIIFEDYDKGCLDEFVISFTIEEAIKKGIPTAVDPKKRNFFYYKRASLFKPNLRELEEGLGIKINGNEDSSVKSALNKLHKRIKFNNAFITMSENGIFYKGESGNRRFPAHFRSVSDVSGAGDTVISILALGLALKLPLFFLGEMSNLGGGIVCEYPGVMPIIKEKLLKETINNEDLMDLLK